MRRIKRKYIIEERIKIVLELERELKKNRKAQDNLGYIVLDKPIRDGWFRTFTLRDDILKSKDAKIYQEVIDAVKIEIWGRSKKFANKNWIKYNSKKHYHYQRPGVKFLSEKEYTKLSSKAKKQFLTVKLRRLLGYKRVHYCFLPKYYFHTHYRRAYVTQLKITSPELEKREQEILEILNRTEYRKHSIYFRYRSYFWNDPIKRERRKVKMALQSNDSDKIEQVYGKHYTNLL